MDYFKSGKTNYFYVDESGNISNDSNIFIHGCIKTDSPDTIQHALEKLKVAMADNLYYEKFRNRILNKGFHATEDTFDMRADFYKLLPLLDYRSYFVLLNKETEYFKQLNKFKQEHEIFKLSLENLIGDRIKKHYADKNIFIFEQIQISRKSLKTILEEIFDSLDDTYDCNFKIVGKDEVNLAVVDYLNFIFNNLLSKEVTVPRMKQNFEIVAPKIAIIKMLHNNVFLSRKQKPKHKVTLENLLRGFSGCSG